MAKDTQACNVCGDTNMKLVDGYYYCVECGTQDTNVRETVVEHTMLADGTFAQATSRKFALPNDGVKMSEEWYKWHSVNFILLGLTDELVRLGAKPTLKMKVLWVWTRYLKKYQNRDEMGLNEKSKRDTIFDMESDDTEKSDEKTVSVKTGNRLGKSVSVITKPMVFGMLVTALNLDKSDIQIWHLISFIKNGQLSYFNCHEHVPKDVNLRSLAFFGRFVRDPSIPSMRYLLRCSMTYFNELKLGQPLMPDLDKILNDHMKELCLPNDLKQLILSLMDFVPCDLVHSKALLPDVGIVIMAYIIVAMKMCFGLDDDYEVRLSETVEKVNDEENHMKSYRLCSYSEPTDRLFSFREWCNYIQLRKTAICKYYLPMARTRGLPVSDYVLMEHLEPRPNAEDRTCEKMSNEVTMDIINAIPLQKNAVVIPKSEFAPSLTALATYNDVVVSYMTDPDYKLRLSEDFTQYSLKYAIENLTLPLSGSDNKVLKLRGIDIHGKVIHNSTTKTVGILTSEKVNADTVFVRNCENKNWLKTKPPTTAHLTEVDSNGIDKEADHGYDSNIENTPAESDETANEDNSDVQEQPEYNKKLEDFEPEDENINIFDDDFLEIKSEPVDDNFGDTKVFEDSFHENPWDDSKAELHIENGVDSTISLYDPDTFNREQTIKSLVIAKCYEQGIPVPKKYKEKKPREPRKRKSEMPIDVTNDAPKAKRKYTDRAKVKQEVHDLITSYYSSLHHNVLRDVSEQIKSFVENDYDRDYLEEDRGHQSPVINMENDESQINDRDSDTNDLDESENLESEFVENVVDPVLKSDPKFDEKVFDTKQLYVKLQGSMNVDDLLDDEDEDPKTLEILKENFDMFDENELAKLSKLKGIDIVDQCDDVASTRSNMEEPQKDKTKRAKLVKKKPQKFNYWLRHYSWQILRNDENVKQFELELEKNLPRSMHFVIRECASILNSSEYNVYKAVIRIETGMLKKIEK